MTIQQMQHRLNTFVMRGERVIGEVVNDWRSWAVLGTAVLGFVVAQNWEGLKQTMNTWFTSDEVSPRATMMAVIPTVESQPMFVPKSIDPIPRSLATKTQTSTATAEVVATAKPLTDKEKLLNIATPVWSQQMTDYAKGYWKDNPDKINASLTDDNKPGNVAYMFYGIPENVFESEGKFYANVFINNTDSVLVEIDTLRYFNGSISPEIEDKKKIANLIIGNSKEAFIFLSQSRYGTKNGAALKIRMATNGSEILVGELDFRLASLR